MKDIKALLVEEFEWPPNWFVNMRLSFPARKIRRLAMIRSRIFARHSSRIISR